MGKVIKNIILVLIVFLIVSVCVAVFITDDKTRAVPLSEITNMIKDQKINQITVGPDTLTAQVKDSDTKLSATVGGNTQIPQYFIDSGVNADQISKIKIEFKNSSFMEW